MNWIKGLFLVCFCVFLAGCSSTKLDVQPQPNVLRLHLGGEPSFLNPILLTDGASHSVVKWVFNGLFKRESDLQLSPDLVEKYILSEDGLTYTFYLRNDVRWHDGELFSAEDVAFTFETIVAPSTNTVRRSHFIIGGKPVRWNVVDETTIQAHLAEPYAPFIEALTMGVLPKHLLATEDINIAAFNRMPVGTGPFKFDAWEPAQYVSLKKNSDYFRGDPLLDQVILRIIPDTNTSLVAFENGELDAVSVPPKDLEVVSRLSGVSLFQYLGMNYSYMGINLRRPHLSDVRVRQAIAHAVDKQSIIQSVLKGFGRPAHIPSSPLSWAYPKDEASVCRVYDPQHSRWLLRESGYEEDDEGYFLDSDGERLSFRLVTTQGSQSSKQIAQLLQHYFKAIGLTIEIQLLEWSSFLKILHEPVDPKDYDLVMLGWVFDIFDPDDSYTMWHSSLYPEGGNVNGFSDALVDHLLEEGRRVQSQSDRYPIYQKLFRRLADQVPYLFLFHAESHVVVRDWVKGLSDPGPAGLFLEPHRLMIQP